MSQSSNSIVRREQHGARQVLSSPCGFAPNLKKAVLDRESHWPLTPQRGCQLAVRGHWTKRSEVRHLMLANSTPRLRFGQRRDDTQATVNSLELEETLGWHDGFV